MRDLVTVDSMHQQMRVAGRDMFLPMDREDDGSKRAVFRHHPLEHVDMHKLDDKAKILIKIENERLLERVRNKLNISKEAHQQIRDRILADKLKLEERLKEEELRKKEEEMKKAATEIKDHSGGTGAQGGAPEDKLSKQRRDKIKEVSHLCMTMTWTGSML